MADWEIQSCRACLLKDNVSVMYDLSMPEVFGLYAESISGGCNVSFDDGTPQFICNMCYRICDLWQGFRERAEESEKRFRKAHQIRRQLQQGKPRRSLKVDQYDAPPPPPPPPEAEEEEDEEENFQPMEVVAADEADEEEIDECENVKENPFEEPERDEPENEVDCDESESQRKTFSKPVKSPVKRRFPFQKTPNKAPRKDRKKQTKSEVIDKSELVFGPGPNNKGIWQHFQRSVCKQYSKCNLCGKVFSCQAGSTTNPRKHLILCHSEEYYESFDTSNQTHFEVTHADITSE